MDVKTNGLGKKVVSLALLGATTSLMAMYGEHAYLYKDPRIMGMGGANVAVGGYSTSVFSNPAGLASIKKEHGMVVDLLGIGVSASVDNAQNLIDDIDAAGDDAGEMVDVLTKYSGENFHLGVDNYTAISRNGDAFAWSIGFLSAVDANFVTYGNGSSTGGLLDTTTRIYGGVVVGVAKPYETEIGHLDVGFSVKYISQISYEGSLTVADLVDDNNDLEQQFRDKYEKESTGIGLDIGVAYHPFKESGWDPVFGLSVLNIGSMSMDDAYGGQPLTVNVGVSVTPELSFLNELVFAVDYMDLFNANKIRLYDYSTNENEVQYTDYEESDFMKRLRVGVGVGLFDTWLISTKLNAGLYQGAYTAGLDFQLAILKLNVATYQEQLGTGGVDIPDRRYMAKLAIGW